MTDLVRASTIDPINAYAIQNTKLKGHLLLKQNNHEGDCRITVNGSIWIEFSAQLLSSCLCKGNHGDGLLTLFMTSDSEGPHRVEAKKAL